MHCLCTGRTEERVPKSPACTTGGKGAHIDIVVERMPRSVSSVGVEATSAGKASQRNQGTALGGDGHCICLARQAGSGQGQGSQSRQNATMEGNVEQRRGETILLQSTHRRNTLEEASSIVGSGTSTGLLQLQLLRGTE